MKREEVLTIDEAIKFVDRCHCGTRCPYINGGDIRRLIGERNYLSQRLDEMEGLMGVGEAEIEKLRRESEDLKEEKEALRYDLKQMLGRIFKPQIKPHHDANQPKRGDPCGHRGDSRRRPEVISEFIDIYPDKCDRCGGQVNVYPNTFDEHVIEDIEIKKRVTCYRFHYGYCQPCKKVVYPRKTCRLMIELAARLGQLAATCAISALPTARQPAYSKGFLV